MPNALIMAGGTGGHVYPALAIANALREQGWGVSWVGTRDKIEARVVPANDIDIDFIDVSGVRGKGAKGLLTAPFKMAKALWQAKQVVNSRKPDLVVGFGGFVSAPGGVAAKVAGIPLVIQEQNAVAGSANKMLSKLASKVATGFSNVLPDAQHTGNPVRQEIAALAHEPRDSEQLNVLVVGGSLGAQIFNQQMPKIASQLGCNVWHQTGELQHAKTVQAYQDAGDDNTKVTAFIEDIDQAYEWADIVLCRAGALTVSEVAIAGLPAIFVPLPHAIDDHQTANARWLSDRDAAVLLPQKEITELTLVKAIESLKPVAVRQKMYQQLQQLAKPNAVNDIVAICNGEVAHG